MLYLKVYHTGPNKTETYKYTIYRSHANIQKSLKWKNGKDIPCKH